MKTSGVIRTTFGSANPRVLCDRSAGSARKREDAAPRSYLEKKDGNDHPRLRNGENGRLLRVTTRRGGALVAGVFSLFLLPPSPSLARLR